MSTEAEKHALKADLVRDRMDTLDQIGGVSGKALSGKARELSKKHLGMLRRPLASAGLAL